MVFHYNLATRILSLDDNEDVQLFKCPNANITELNKICIP